MEHREFTFDSQGLITTLNYQDIDDPSIVCQQANEYEAEPSTTASAYKSGSGFAALINRNEEDKVVPTKSDGAAPMLIKKVREKKLKAFYEAAFGCRLRRNQGNTQLLDTFLNYLNDTAKLCVVNNNEYGDDSETCHDKDEIREMMGDRYADDNESIDHEVEIISNDGYKVESKVVSQRRKPNGCIVIKEEYDTCLFNDDGDITKFTVNQSSRRTECDNYEDEE
eukprot:CAMPEP_0201579160 /NCGR_PEP_ID=MMETSP0190_2-20130828/26529_1 /ASSEMBLY_ACC=CAM_ASM_000263 /TAXON_ID=37353 /ORGANISM="Rosalina sp." /LENGTH=223 /DNA_ID=CAMNT_0048013235 /DNA_START=29 /DNA_END=700 /DNA_ORIENTATION=+